MAQPDLPKTLLGSPISERIVQRLEVIRGETLGEINKLFREKVQTTEKLDDIHVNIHYKRGFMDAFEKFCVVVQEINDGEKVEALRAKRLAEIAEAKSKARVEVGVTPDGNGGMPQ